MDDQELQNTLLAAYRDAPSSVQALITSGKVASLLQEIQTTQKLSDVIASRVADELLLLLLGMGEEEEFVDNLKEIPGIPPDSIDPIVGLMSEKLFSQLQQGVSRPAATTPVAQKSLPDLSKPTASSSLPALAQTHAVVPAIHPVNRIASPIPPRAEPITPRTPPTAATTPSHVSVAPAHSPVRTMGSDVMAVKSISSVPKPAPETPKPLSQKPSIPPVSKSPTPPEKKPAGDPYREPVE